MICSFNEAFNQVDPFDRKPLVKRFVINKYMYSYMFENTNLVKK